MSAQWYYAHNNKKHGPYSATQLKQLAASGQRQAGDMILKEGAAKWMLAAQVKGLFAAPTQVRSDASSPTKSTPATFANLAGPTSAGKSSPNKPKSGRRKAMIWTGAAGVLMIGLAVGLVVYLMGGKNSKPKQDDSTMSQRSDSLDASVLTKGNAKG